MKRSIYFSLSRRSSKGLPLFFLLALLLAACGGQAASNTSQGNDSGGRTIKHAMGTTTVPAHPSRVVVLDTGELDDCITLRVIPVGAVSAFQDSGYLSYLQGQTRNITNVGTIAQPNLETIASLNPDLILSSKMRDEGIYDKLSQIAPTVFSEDVGDTWKDNFMLFANALNKTAEAQTLMQQYQQHIDAFKQAMSDHLATTQVSVVRVLADRTRIYLQSSFVGTILKDAGLPSPPAQQDPKQKFLQDVSYENISSMDGDVIFLSYYGDSADKVKELTSQPQWKQLKAVKAGRVYNVSDDVWMLGLGLGAANKVVDDLTASLTK